MCNYREINSQNNLTIDKTTRLSKISVVHDLKINPEFFDAIINGNKKFEIRDNTDRNFDIGDILVLREWSQDLKIYTGKTIKVKVTYIFNNHSLFNIPKNISILSIELIK